MITEKRNRKSCGFLSKSFALLSILIMMGLSQLQWLQQEKKITSYLSSIRSQTESKPHETPIVATPSFEGNGKEKNTTNSAHWPQLKQKLCPIGLPNLSLGKTLFQLGREELGIPENTIRSNEKYVNYFFNVTDGFNLIVDDKDPSSSLLYVRTWKCANDQIRHYLEKHFDRRKSPAGNSTYTNLDLNMNSVREMFHKQPKEGNYNQTATFAKADTDEDDNSLWYKGNSYEKPCVVTAIRDPISHFLSGYNEIEYRTVTGRDIPPRVLNDKNLPAYTRIPYKSPERKKKKETRKLDSSADGKGETTTGERTTNKTNSVKAAMTKVDDDVYNGDGYLEANDPRMKQSLEIRFETFVRNLLEEHPTYTPQKHAFIYKHAYPLSRILHGLEMLGLLPTTRDNWFLPGLQNLTHTFPRYLAEKCPRVAANYPRNSGFPPMEVAKTHGSATDSFGFYQAAKDVWKRGSSAARALCHLHAFDYTCFYGNEVADGGSFGFEDIPAVCRDIYASNWFRERILKSNTK